MKQLTRITLDPEVMGGKTVYPRFADYRGSDRWAFGGGAFH